MPTESFHALALPHSVRPPVKDDDFHVSLFIAPRLEPDGEEQMLDAFDVFPDWATALVDSFELRLEDQDGVIEGVEPLLHQIDPAVWHELFPPKSTPVRANRVPDWRDRGWRSFDAGTVADIAKLVHVATVATSLTAPPDPRRHFLGRLSERGLVIATGSDDDREIEGLGPAYWWDSNPTGKPGGVDDMVRQLHRARRFYERPEEMEQQPYRAQPDPNAATKPLPSPEPEFHARCAMAGDHPTLLRRLGLVVDLQVLDLDRLSRSTYLVATLSVDGDPGLCRQQKVLCTAYDDGSFTTVSQLGDWHAGALALGEEDRFSVIDVDADGSALKTERFLGILPQLIDIANNGDPATAATPALRAGGFTLARRHRAHYTEDRIPRQLDIEAGAGLDLHTEDVLRGMRVEVWDDTVDRWHSLHERTSRIEVGAVTVPATDPGFVQGTAAGETSGVDKSKIHVHEALVGWEGWSLSVQRPGRRIRHVHAGDPDLADADRREVVEDTPDTPILGEKPPHPVHATHEVAKGSLPRLRFGRDYAFRAWAVDLAGNSRVHELNPPIVPNLAPVLPQLPGLDAAVVPVQPTLSAGIRALAHETLESARLTASAVAALRPLRADVRDTLIERVRSTRDVGGLGAAARRTPSVARGVLLDNLAADAVADPDQPLLADTTIRSPERLVDLIASHAAAIGGLQVEPSLSDAAKAALGTITKLKPFLRWDPVLAPAVVPTKKYTEGESVRVVVIRSGVSQDPDTLAITVTDPTAYAAAANAAVASLDYADTSSRHLAPQKTSQVTAELHAMFDLGIGTGDAAKNQKMLDWALIEDGSLFDADRGSLDDPLTRVAQPGRAIVVQSDHSVVRDENDPDFLPGDPLGPGQYVVHDTPDLTLPYLPDPMAAGVSLRFTEASRHGIPAPEGEEGFTAAYPGTWPAVEPIRMDLVGSPVLEADVKGRVLSLRLPAADVQRFRLSSSLPAPGAPPSLDFERVMGVWRSLPPILTGDADVQEAARDGWIWGLTPAEDVTLVHAVPRPLEAPRPVKIWAERDAGANSAHLVGVVDVHGASTDSLIAEAAWTDPVDELDKPPTTRSTSAIGFQTKLTPDEDLLILEESDGVAEWEYGSLKEHAAVHEFGDTKHHLVTYTLRATTRFAEYFHPDLLQPTYDGDDGRSVVSAPLVVDVPSSAPPAAPLVHSVLPLFRWDEGTEAEQPMAWRHERRTGVRIYLERPWFSSGDGELLGVLLAPHGHDDFGGSVQDDSGFPFVSKIGGDPVWHHRSVDNRALSNLHLDSLLHSEGYDPRPAPGRPAVVRSGVSVRAGGSSYDVKVAGYRPAYNAERKLWYVDVAIDPWASLDGPTPAFWPFVRLAVARFQPSSVHGCELSPPVRCDFVQLPPERTTSVSRTDERHVRVVLSGTRGWRDSHPERGFDTNRIVVAALQQRDPQIPTDLGWRTVDRKVLPIRSDATEWEVAWMGELDAGKAIPLRRPAPGGSGTPRWRVRVEEWEGFEGDPTLDGERTWERRLVFADDVVL